MNDKRHDHIDCDIATLDSEPLGKTWRIRKFLNILWKNYIDLQYRDNMPIEHSQNSFPTSGKDDESWTNAFWCYQKPTSWGDVLALWFVQVASRFSREVKLLHCNFLQPGYKGKRGLPVTQPKLDLHTNIILNSLPTCFFRNWDRQFCHKCGVIFLGK